MTSPFWRLWGWPIWLGLASAIGLLAALLGDGFWDWLSALMLAAPVATCAWFGWRRTSSRAAREG